MSSIGTPFLRSAERATIKEALAMLERAADDHASSLESLLADPSWEDLRTHPRFQAILKRMHLAK